LRDLILVHFYLEENIDDRHKRFRIPGALSSPFAQLNVAKIAALQSVAETARRAGSAQAPLLESLAGKVHARASGARSKAACRPISNSSSAFSATMSPPAL